MAAGVVFSVIGCSGGEYPISVDVSVPVAKGYSVENYGEVGPGDPITPDMDIPPVPVCTLPDSDGVDAMIQDAVGDFVGGMVEMERLELLDVTIRATQGDFNSITELSMYYEPKPVLGVAQPVIELGEASSSGGLGSTITLEPPDSVDFLELIENNEANPTPDCPKFGVRMRGLAPTVAPRWDVDLNVRVIGHIGI
jgi:hypothetical protein